MCLFLLGKLTGGWECVCVCVCVWTVDGFRNVRVSESSAGVWVERLRRLLCVGPNDGKSRNKRRALAGSTKILSGLGAEI